MRLRHVLYVMVMFQLVLFPGQLLNGEEPDRSDPVKVANHVLQSIRSGDYETVINLMNPEQQKEYLPITPENRAEIERIFNRDKKNAGNTKQISELRKVTTVRGKNGIAAKVNKTDDAVFVIILAFEDNKYYFDTTLMLSRSVYNKLEFVKKVK
ncbi:MAG: hypothetical protein ACM3SY_19210 [Candidatus Omnitrophota bacterium]